MTKSQNLKLFIANLAKVDNAKDDCGVHMDPMVVLGLRDILDKELNTINKTNNCEATGRSLVSFNFTRKDQ